MRIALVCDDLVQFGGAERLVLALHEIWPEAPLFTSFASKAWRRRCQNLGVDLRTSWMQRLPFKEKLFRHYFLFFPHAFESFDFNEFDVVLSVSARFAHSIITSPRTKHICYMNTPPRMFWEPFDYFGRGSFLLPFLSWLRVWDYSAGQRPDLIIANCKTPWERIRKYYGREAEIVYPFVDLERFKRQETDDKKASANSFTSGVKSPFAKASADRSADAPEVSLGRRASEYYLIVSRLQAWKRVDLAIEACNQLKLHLVIIGEGLDGKRLQRLAGPTVKIVGNLTDEEVIDYYYGCRALIFPQVEDFGITPLEAMAAGKPVIAARAGGALETVVQGKTGEFFWPQTMEALVGVLESFDPKRYSAEACRKQARRFGKERFVKGIKEVVMNYS